MNVQEAYNKGLDDAENAIYLSYSSALSGEDVGELSNPKMEELRQIILKNKKGKTIDSSDEAIRKIVLGEDVEVNDKAFQIFKELMDHFYLISKKKNNVGKAFARIINEKKEELSL